MEQEEERRKRAEERFKEWLAKANEKSRASPKSPCYPTSKVISVIWELLTMLYHFVINLDHIIDKIYLCFLLQFTIQEQSQYDSFYVGFRLHHM